MRKEVVTRMDQNCAQQPVQVNLASGFDLGTRETRPEPRKINFTTLRIVNLFVLAISLKLTIVISEVTEIFGRIKTVA